MITASGVYRIDVLQTNNNATYLSDGVYDVTVDGNEVDFRQAIHANAWGWAPGTFDRVSMMNIFEKQRPRALHSAPARKREQLSHAERLRNSHKPDHRIS